MSSEFPQSLLPVAWNTNGIEFNEAALSVGSHKSLVMRVHAKLRKCFAWKLALEEEPMRSESTAPRRGGVRVTLACRGDLALVSLSLFEG